MEIVQESMFDKIISLFKKIFMKPKMLGEGIAKEDNTKFDKKDLKKLSFDAFLNLNLETIYSKAVECFESESVMKKKLKQIKKDNTLLNDISIEELRQVNEYFDKIIDV